MSRSRTRPAAFLDRDGVLNEDTGFVHRIADFRWLDGAESAVKSLNDRGYFVFVITNQSGVARGFFPAEAVERLHQWMNDELAKLGAHVDAFYYCPHHPTAGTSCFTRPCDCRKPAPGMLLRAMAEWPVDREASFLLGDQARDLEAARRAGLRSVRFSGGNLRDAIDALLA